MIPCKHWTECGVNGGGCCSLGLFGGRPSVGTCGHCEHNANAVAPFLKSPAPPSASSVAQTIAHGAAGLVKAALGIGRADDATIDRRRGVCGTCDQAVMVLGVLEKCRACGCGIVPKTANADEVCPLGKWAAQGT
jgi:hypothetical protein